MDDRYMNKNVKDKILLIDGHSIMNRAYYGLPDLTNGDGIHTGAIYGFLSTMFRVIDEEQPNYLAVAFDVHEPTFRHKVYTEYKAGRSPMHEELKQQIPLIKDILRAMNIPVIEKGGIEADDILGTIARMGESKGMEVTILSGDRDLLQIATETTKISVPKTFKGKTTIENYYAKDVLEKYKVTPEQYIELKALKGDSSDNIKGVPGVGEKTAEDLMVQFGSIEGIYSRIDEISRKSVKENLLNNRETLDLCLFLVTIKTDCEFDFNIEDAIIDNLFTEEAYDLYKKYELKNFYSRFEEGISSSKTLLEEYQIINSDSQAKEIIRLLESSGEVGLVYYCKENDAFTENDGQMSLFDEPSDTGVSAIGVAFSDNQVYYADTSKLSFDIIGELLLKACDNNHKTFVYDAKRLYKYINRDGLKSKEATKNLYDVLIGEYLINPVRNEYDISDIVKDHVGPIIATYKQLFDKMQWDEALEKENEKFSRHIAEFALSLLKAGPSINDTIADMGMWDLYINMEMPLSYVLHNMEVEGMLVDREALKNYGDNLVAGINGLEANIYEAAGKEFNINSPKQLATILFEEMKLEGGKKTKTGYSTSAEVLEKLAEEHPFVRDILEYRTLTKLKSTYADGLANFIGDDERIHTTFNQTITATGRISSTDPNLQNIPMRMELGRSIRKVFIPKSGYKFVDADYSQIELRILAAMSGDEELIEAYKSGNDIHAITASKVFHVPLEEVTDLQRRNAKAVNFGIVYGISSFGLGQDLSISREEASQYIKDYFKSYTGIKEFLDKTKEDAKKNGYSTTLYGRRRPIPELHSSNFMQRAFGERVAMNAPIQGTAADIMKIAMINVYDRILEEKLESKMILQVHDELVIETKDEEIDKITNIIIEEMSHAADLSVKLEVSCHTGSDWYEAK